MINKWIIELKIILLLLFFVTGSPSPNSLQDQERAVDEPDLNSVNLILQEDDTTVHNAAHRDGQEERVQNGESYGNLEVEVHHHAPISDTQNTNEEKDLSILEKQAQIHDEFKDTNANGVGYVLSQAPTAADKSQPNHVVNNKKLVNFFF